MLPKTTNHPRVHGQFFSTKKQEQDHPRASRSLSLSLLKSPATSTSKAYEQIQRFRRTFPIRLWPYFLKSQGHSLWHLLGRKFSGSLYNLFPPNFFYCSKLDRKMVTTPSKWENGVQSSVHAGGLCGVLHSRGWTLHWKPKWCAWVTIILNPYI